MQKPFSLDYSSLESLLKNLLAASAKGQLYTFTDLLVMQVGGRKNWSRRAGAILLWANAIMI
jgi:hypothetical protein